MISNENILNLETRNKIYNFISKNPGLHLMEISRKRNIPKSTLRYHLNFLISQGLVTQEEHGGYLRYYIIKKIGRRDRELFNLLRQDGPRKIILLLLYPGPGDIYKNSKAWKKGIRNPDSYLRYYSKSELVELTKYWSRRPLILHKHRRTIDFHLKKLLDADLIKKVKIGKGMKYRLKDEHMIWDFLIRFQYELSNQGINSWLRGIENLFKNNQDFFGKNIEKAVFDVFPHPYYG
jgi:DNA-binding transcriptional ArsR family regulator